MNTETWNQRKTRVPMCIPSSTLGSIQSSFQSIVLNCLKCLKHRSRTMFGPPVVTLARSSILLRYFCAAKLDPLAHVWHTTAVFGLCPNPTGQRYAWGALVTSFRVEWLSEIVGYCNMADYSWNTICDWLTVKRCDWTRHEHYNILSMWRIHCWV